jgi:acetoin utilization protein AcuB
VLIKDIMISRNLITVQEGDRLALAAQKMSWGRLRHLPVLRGDELVGVISERDILGRRGDGDGRWEDALVGAVMSHPPAVAVPEEEVAQAAALMAARRIGCLPVVKRGRLVGMLTTTDLVGSAVNDLYRDSSTLARPVSQAMCHDVASVRDDDSLTEVVEVMKKRGVRHVPVIDRYGRVVGIVSDRDVRASVGDPVQASEGWPGTTDSVHVTTVMARDPVVVSLDSTLSVAVKHLLGRRVGALPVVDPAGRLVGILSYIDVIRALAAGGDADRIGGAA